MEKIKDQVKEDEVIDEKIQKDQAIAEKVKEDQVIRKESKEDKVIEKKLKEDKVEKTEITFGQFSAEKGKEYVVKEEKMKEDQIIEEKTKKHEPIEEKVDDELICFLKDTSLCAKARSKGWEAVLSLTATNDGLNHILHSKKYVPFLVSQVMEEKHEESTSFAFQSLINISAVDLGSVAMITNTDKFLLYLLDSVSKSNTEFEVYKCYLLANMSSSRLVLEEIVSILKGSRILFRRLVQEYCCSPTEIQEKKDFLTLFFANISRIKEGRKIMFSELFFFELIKDSMNFRRHESRRLGTALILRNCCLDLEYHSILLKEIEILPTLLLPLMESKKYEENDEMGHLPEEIQKMCLEQGHFRDESVSVRRVLVEALIALCYCQKSWKFLKANGVYYVIRDLHAKETDEASKELMEQLVTYLLVENYKKPMENEPISDISFELISQLENEVLEVLPDFFVKPERNDA